MSIEKSDPQNTIIHEDQTYSNLNQKQSQTTTTEARRKERRKQAIVHSGGGDDDTSNQDTFMNDFQRDLLVIGLVEEGYHVTTTFNISYLLEEPKMEKIEMEIEKKTEVVVEGDEGIGVAEESIHYKKI
eukprot:CAMPEP_0114352722 /NCGR_PEP_ID=MMETSP0101-20121206/18145_1 /TAXON_ID=38822 ORGANISM="Pteridomonas danica, Strain PT" /NCGR_SAMPLE_ID=MMETSP0101 /ASSEMBLY_ACC=CAM_ASM_000211 /LENGTH=128 /DNA_ID=CAMNT_0001493237 /DNA_START=704 /DNA_END=1090 /DNA_ORIENTATION=-